jgi:hypothetical protein
MTFPLTCVSLGDRPELCALGEAVGQISLAFGVSMEPQLLLEAADVATRPLLDKVTAPVLDLVSRTEVGVRKFLNDTDWVRAEQSTREFLHHGAHSTREFIHNARMRTDWLAHCRAATGCDVCDGIADFHSPRRSCSFGSSSSSSSDGLSPYGYPVAYPVAYPISNPAVILYA